MKKDIFKNMNKTTKTNMVTYAIVVVAYLVMQVLVSTGSVSSLMQGLLVPLCVYVILVL